MFLRQSQDKEADLGFYLKADLLPVVGGLLHFLLLLTCETFGFIKVWDEYVQALSEGWIPCPNVEDTISYASPGINVTVLSHVSLSSKI